MFRVIDQMIQAAFGSFTERAFGAEIGNLVIVLISVGILVLVTAGTWRAYEKAGEPGWACLVPIYNLIVLLRIAGERWWCILLFMIPVINVVVHLLICAMWQEDLVKAPCLAWDSSSRDLCSIRF